MRQSIALLKSVSKFYALQLYCVDLLGFENGAYLRAAQEDLDAAREVLLSARAVARLDREHIKKHMARVSDLGCD